MWFLLLLGVVDENVGGLLSKIFFPEMEMKL